LLDRAFNSRRRRRAGMRPYYGTRWMAGRIPVYNNPGLYDQQGPPAPPYSPPVNNQYTGNTFRNDGYFGQQSGIELQPPKQTYTPRGGDPVYEAPEGPPPNKGGYQNDGVIR
jgi:Chitin synthesis regulation, resistance to Congo red